MSSLPVAIGQRIPGRWFPSRWFGALLSTLMIAVGSNCLAGQDSDNNTSGGLQASQDLRHRVVIPQIIYFRVGSPAFGDASMVEFNVSPSAGAGNNQTFSGVYQPPIGNGSAIDATGVGALQVALFANVGTVNISYDLSNPLGLVNGTGEFIPFDEISVITGDAGLPAPPLANAGDGGAIAVPVAGNLHSGRVIRRQTTWTYRYDNSTAVRAGTYQGSVRYTVAAP